jgi:EpsI family protein
LLAITLVCVVVCNWVRVYAVILIGHLTDMQHYLVAVEHRNFGWALFAVFLVPVMLAAHRLERTAVHETSEPMPVGQPGYRRGIVLAAVTVALLLAVPRIVAAVWSGTGAELTASAAPLAMDSPWRPVFMQAREEAATIGGGTARIELYRASYARQDATHRLIAYHNSFVPASWSALVERRRTVDLQGVPTIVLELEGYLAGQRRIVWGWYTVAGKPVSSALAAKLLELRGIFVGRRDAAATAVSTQCDVDCEGARHRLGELLADPSVSTHLVLAP